MYKELQENRILTELSEPLEGDRSEEGTKHFVTPNGINSLVKFYLQKSGTNKFKSKSDILFYCRRNYNTKIHFKMHTSKLLRNQFGMFNFSDR